MIKAISPYSIEQDLVTDCSFIASLCICAAFERRFNKPLITKIIYPQSKDGVPGKFYQSGNNRLDLSHRRLSTLHSFTSVYNPSGKYMVRLWANGVARKVVVDDLLPVDSRGRLICSSSNVTGEVIPNYYHSFPAAPLSTSSCKSLLLFPYNQSYGPASSKKPI